MRLFDATMPSVTCESVTHGTLLNSRLVKPAEASNSSWPIGWRLYCTAVELRAKYRLHWSVFERVRVGCWPPLVAVVNAVRRPAIDSVLVEVTPVTPEFHHVFAVRVMPPYRLLPTVVP